MKVFLIALIALSAGLGSCSQNGNMSREELQEAIVIEVLMERCGEEIDSGITLVLSSEFSAGRLMSGETADQFLANLESQAEEFGTSFIEATRDFVAANIELGGEREFPRLPFLHVLHSEEDWKILNQKTIAGKPVPNRNRGWATILEEHPGGPGFISLSRPGLSEDGTVAFIYLEVLKLRGQGCSGGNLYVFVLVNGEWVFSKDTLQIGWIA